MKQKDIFLNSEGDNWFKRNVIDGHVKFDPSQDNVLTAIAKFEHYFTSGDVNILEIGCGQGHRLKWLKEHSGYNCYGIDPSEMSVESARAIGVNATLGTADSIPFSDKTFDIVLFGFCLYLCDREDLFRIAAECFRTLKPNSWIIINDFFSTSHTSSEYIHKDGVRSFKMDYSSIFTWHPNVTCFSQFIYHHEDMKMTDRVEEWVATSVLRRCNNF